MYSSRYSNSRYDETGQRIEHAEFSLEQGTRYTPMRENLSNTQENPMYCNGKSHW